MKLSEANPILRNLLSDIASQPQWRGEAAVDMAWRDNRQWSKAQIEYLESLGLTPMQVNLIAPAMEAVTGYEAKHRVDWMVSAASEEQDDMAEAINHKMNDEMRLANANSACSDAYESQSGVGIGWVHVTKNPDPLAPGKLLIEDVHRDEIWWDMRSRSNDLRRDCRWLARRKFFDKDSAKAFLGAEYADVVDFTFSDWRTVEIAEEDPGVDWFAAMYEYTNPLDLILDNNSGRPMVAIYEVYYKVVENKDLIFSQDGAVMEFMKGNPLHLEILASGFGRLEQQVPIYVCKLAWFVGPHLIWDGPSPEPHNHFPYVPFIGCREDGTNCPVGLIRRMRGPQEQYNRAVVEIQRILRSRRIEKDYDALKGMTDAQAVFEINRTDGVINKNHGKDFQVIREWEKIAALEGICKRSREEVNAASGIYQTFQGQTEAEQSGVAVESIAELGAQSLGKINSNYQLARQCVGDLVFAHIVSNIGFQRTIVNIPQQVGQQKKQVILNDGANNRVSMLRAQVTLQDIHTSAGYKQHTHARLTSIMKELPDEFKAPLIPFWLESSELPKKEQAIKMFNKMLGFEQDDAKQAQNEQAQQQAAEQQRQLEIRKFVAEVEDLEASRDQKKAQASKATAEALKARVEVAELIRQFKMGGIAAIQGQAGQGALTISGGQPQGPEGPAGPGAPPKQLPPGKQPAQQGQPENNQGHGAPPPAHTGPQLPMLPHHGQPLQAGAPPSDQRQGPPPGAPGANNPPAGRAPVQSLHGVGMKTAPRDANTVKARPEEEGE